MAQACKQEGKSQCFLTESLKEASHHPWQFLFFTNKSLGLAHTKGRELCKGIATKVSEDHWELF